ncbi:hypothetical protein XELAEV_18000547mg [Xenopus laevis]|nr:hypothetical protein XELAEV_18000547mg [Xenopus laevis]
MLYTDNQLKQIFPELPPFSYRQPPNLRKMIVRSALPKTTKAGHFPATATDVKPANTSCAKIKLQFRIQINLHHSGPLFVCFIQCGIHDYMRIYGTLVKQNLRTRMNHHRHKINTKSCDTPVGQHFCSQNHSLQDMQVLILKGNLKTERERKIYEFKWSGFMSHYVT